jgi:hypothetical protein
MTKRASGSSGQMERASMKAELQRIVEHRHVGSVIRNARRVRLRKKRAALVKAGDPVKVARTVPAPESRPLTPAEQERIEERRRVESVMRNARRSRLRLRKKLVAACSGGGEAVAANVETSAGPPAPGVVIRPLATVFGVVALALVCALLGLTLKTAFQNNRLAKDLVDLRRETAALKDKQQESLDGVEQAFARLAATEAALAQESLSRIEKVTREGLAGVAERLDREEALAAAVDRLLPLLQPSGATAPVQTASATPPVP